MPPFKFSTGQDFNIDSCGTIPRAQTPKRHTTVHSLSRDRISSGNYFQALTVATSISHGSCACTEEMYSVSGGWGGA